jgi:integrase
VRDPETIWRKGEIQIARALTAQLWDNVRAHVHRQGALDGNQLWRIVQALILCPPGMSAAVPGDDGLEVWALPAVGKRPRERTVPVSAETVRALRAHWLDRGDDFDAPSVTGPLIATLVILNTAAARRKHAVAIHMPYEYNHIYRLIEWLRTRPLAELDALSPSTHAQLAQMTPHAFRHTFGTLAATKDLPIDVFRRVLGHRSIQTTSIYLQTEKRRMMNEVGAMFGRWDTVKTGQEGNGRNESFSNGLGK